MPYSIPEFPLLMDIYSMPVAYDFLERIFRERVTAQLRLFGPRPRANSSFYDNGGLLVANSAVLVPAGTDLRDSGCTGLADLVELPATSGRWYYVAYVDDVAKGFANEYRQGILVKVVAGGAAPLANFVNWPTPIP